MFVLNLYSKSQLVYAGVPVKAQVTIGRDPLSDLTIPEPSISRQHLILRLEKIGPREVIVLRDGGSRNGTFVNAQRVQERAVGPGDLIRFGCCRLELLRVKSPFTSPGKGPKGTSPGKGPKGSDTVVYKWNPFSDNLDAAGRLRALYTMGLCLGDLEIPFMLEKAAEIVRSCVEFDQLSILLEGKKGLVLCTSWNREGPCGKDEILLGQKLIKGCMQLGQPSVSNNLREAGLPSEDTGRPSDGINSAACVPLRAEGRILGVLFCTTVDAEKQLGQEDLQFLTLVGCFVATGLSHRRHLANAHQTTAKLEAVLGSLQEGVLVCDLEFRILSANKAARSIFARTTLVGLSLEEALSDFVHTFDPSFIKTSNSFDIERRVLKEGTDSTTGLEAYRATVSRSVGLDAEGWLHIICVRDVTRERMSELTQLAFVHRLAHKLRTPLTVIGCVHSLISPRLASKHDKEVEELFLLAYDSCEQMAGLIERFVDFASLGKEKKHLRSCQMAMNLRLLVEQSLNLAKEAIDRSGLEVVDETRDSEYQVVVVPEQICQCFLQLIQNACKFAGKGATLTLSVVEKENLTVQFRDDGPGIPEQEMRRVFDIFHQVDMEETGEIPGVGLGLWWTREMIRAQGGDVRVISPIEETGRGTCVEIVFPPGLLVKPPWAVNYEETEEFEDTRESIELFDT